MELFTRVGMSPLAQMELSGRAIESVSDLSYALAHDVRAPLLTIQGFVHELSRSPLSDEGAHLASRVLANSRTAQDRLAAAVEYANLLVTPLCLSRVDVTSLALDAAARARVEYPDKELDIVVEALPAARGDDAMLRKLVGHVMSNATKFSANCRPARIRVSGRNVGDVNVYSVTDNGIGFEQSRSDRLFKLFRRLVREGEYPGIGAGLAVAKLVALRHGGRIWCQADPGVSTTFWFTLPAFSVQPAEKPASEPSGNPGGTLHIITVEDNADDEHIVINEIRNAGWRVVSRRVETELEFRRELALGADVILADYTLPAFSVARALEIREEIGSDVPLIVVTGSISEEVAVDCMKRGAADYLLKDRLKRLPAAVDFAIATATESRARRAAELARDAAMRELDHRVKNNLSVVLNLIEFTAGKSSAVHEFKPAVVGRVRVLEIAHSELAANHWLSANVRSLILRTVLSARKGEAERFHLEGPDEVSLPPRAVAGFSATVHELATNAMKHGAWSTPDGSVSVDIQVLPDSVAIVWTESGGPAVSTPKRRGFGLLVVENQLRYEVGADVRVIFAPTGVVATVSVPKKIPIDYLDCPPQGPGGTARSAER